MLNKLVLSIIALCAAVPAFAEISISSIFGSGMVLQQNSVVTLRGEATPSSRLTVKPTWGGRAATVAVGADGHWTCDLSTPSYGGPYEITVKGDGYKEKDTKTLTDVLIGEVWLCSGQSNMEMPMRGFRGQPVEGSADVIAAASPARKIRLYRQPNAWSTTVVDEIKDAEWTKADAQNVAGFSAVGYVFADQLESTLDIPVGLIQCAWSMSTIEAWMPRTTFEKSFPEIHLPDVAQTEFGWTQGTPTLLWNAMLKPWQGFPIAGVLWFQGEANTPNAERYGRLFPAMVEDWRALFKNDSLPFYYCQLAPWRDMGCEKTLWADFRHVQTQMLDKVPGTGMVTIGDCGDSTFIHFPKKIAVGKRFAYLALENNYGYKGLDSRAPIAEKVWADGDSAYIVQFKHGQHGLTPENATLEGFEIVDDRGVAHPAKAFILNGDRKVKVINPGVKYPAEVRYGYHNYYEASLFNNIGIPAAPFKLQVPRKQKMSLMWVDAEANYRRFSNADSIDYYIKKIADIGFTHAVVCVRPITGEVLYDSEIAPKMPEIEGIGYDYLGKFIEAGKRHGVKIIASMNVFCAGHNYFDRGLIYSDHPEWASVVYDPRHGLIPITEQKHKYGGMVNPLNAEYQEYIINVMKEIVAKYPELDGLMTDRVRYDGIQADFSDLSRKGFEQFIGKKVKNFPEDILSWDTSRRRPMPVEGKLFNQWIEWRARVITDFIARAREAVKSVRADIPFCTYTGAWYPSYYEVGVNFASRNYDPSEDYEWATPAYKETGYAELIDIYATGNYYTDITIEEYVAKGGSEIWNETDSKAQSGIWYCVEGSCHNLRHILGGNEFLGGILVDQFFPNPADLSRTITENLKDSDGLMVFDIVHIIARNLWKEVETGFKNYYE